ncbi:hypothetical protein NHQ30_011534 [Ciborinia camelliae]|nr:hypothetical protein NHQ30_011534 [Ciborinia camelliae]
MIAKFEKAVRSRKDHHAWLSPTSLLAYANAHKKVKTIQSIHMTEIISIRAGTLEVVQAGQKLLKAMTDLDSPLTNIQNDANTLLGEVDNLIHSLLLYKRYYSANELFQHLGLFGKDDKMLDFTMVMATVKRETLNVILNAVPEIKLHIQGSLQHTSNSIINWQLLPEREKMICPFPGVPVFGYSIDFDEISKDWIEQIERWCDGHEIFGKKVKQMREEYIEFIEGD